MLFLMMRHYLGFLVRSMIWLTHSIKRWLDTLDENDIPILECPKANDGGKRQFEESNVHTCNDVFAEWEEFYVPNPPNNKQFRKGQESLATSTNETHICPLCEGSTHIKSAGKGGCVYGCTNYPECKGTRTYSTKRPGPATAIWTAIHIFTVMRHGQ